MAQSLLDALNGTQRGRLVAAMAEVERLMNAAAVAIAAEPEESRDARQCVAAYYKELDERFDGGFDPGNGGYAGKPRRRTRQALPHRATHGRAIGCGALKPIDISTGEIKRMWVAPRRRGLGVARRLLEALEEQARRSGYDRVVLDTNQVAAGSAGAVPQGRLPRRAVSAINDNPYRNDLARVRERSARGREHIL